jgi:hypothetical protein
MKKLLITIGSLLIMTFVVILFVNATESKKDTKKAKTEVKKTETTASCSATCNHSTGDKTAACDPEKCKELNCVHKDGKCDPATCKKGNCNPETCKMACEKTSTEMKCNPAKCNHQVAGQK